MKNYLIKLIPTTSTGWIIFGVIGAIVVALLVSCLSAVSGRD